jgi:hypothetical protein
MVKFKVSVTKEIIAASESCGLEINTPSVGCAIANALKPMFGDTYVGYREVYFLLDGKKLEHKSTLPEIAVDFIKRFDTCKTVEERRELQPLSFDIEIPEIVVSRIGGISKMLGRLSSGQRLILSS